ncbi:MAG: hypothetical protein AABX99_02355 [Nanoarchaeota archaeon]
MYFQKTKEELKKFPLMPVLSYCAIILLIGWGLERMSGLGNLSYFITFIFFPLLGTVTSWLTKGNLINAFREDWLAFPLLVHLLIIIDCLIIFNLIKSITSKELWIKKIFHK